MGDPADLAETDVLVDVSETYGPLRCFRRLIPLLIKVNAHTYLSTTLKGDPIGTTWLGLALTGLEILSARRGALQDVAVIGTGSGLDAVGISHLFTTERLVATDIHPRSLDAARWNIDRYAQPGTECRVTESDLFRSIPREARFDLVFENLPNVPDGTDLLDGIRTASCYTPSAYVRDEVSDRSLLTMHFNCLLEARPHLRDGGTVVCMIGGRVPWPVIAEVFARAGYRAGVLHFGLKVQTEPAVVLDGYARAERAGASRFIYYHPVAACLEILESARRKAGESSCDPARIAGHSSGGSVRIAGHSSGTPGPMRQSAEDLGAPVRRTVEDIEALNRKLERYRVSASEALELHRTGEAICHSVYVAEATIAVDAEPGHAG